MRVRTDDRTYQIDGRFLGFEGKSIPFAPEGIRYRAIPVGVTIWILSLIIGGWCGLSGLTFMVILTGASIFATQAVMRFVDHDRPLATVLEILGQEITAPRPGAEAITAELDPSRLPVQQLPGERGR